MLLTILWLNAKEQWRFSHLYKLVVNTSLLSSNIICTFWKFGDFLIRNAFIFWFVKHQKCNLIPSYSWFKCFATVTVKYYHWIISCALTSLFFFKTARYGSKKVRNSMGMAMFLNSKRLKWSWSTQEKKFLSPLVNELNAKFMLQMRCRCILYGNHEQ